MPKHTEQVDEPRPHLDELDTMIRSELTSVQPPLGLKQSILGEYKQSQKVIPFSFAKIGSIAALLLLTLIAVFAQLYSNRTLSSESEFRAAAAEFIQTNRFRLDYQDSNLNNISEWLATQQIPEFGKLPERLTQNKLLGCKALKWREQDVSLVCFHLESGGIAHLFILDTLDNNHEPTNKTLVADLISRSRGLETAKWQHQGRTYLLVGSEPSVEIDSYI